MSMARFLGAPLLESSRTESLDAELDARAVEMAVGAASAVRPEATQT